MWQPAKVMIRRVLRRTTRKLPWIEVLKKRLQIHNCSERLYRPIKRGEPSSDLSSEDACYIERAELISHEYRHGKAQAISPAFVFRKKINHYSL